ncbi:MAG: flavin monoamine oxidase family protein [Gammaproteobacteria bacterium]
MFKKFFIAFLILGIIIAGRWHYHHKKGVIDESSIIDIAIIGGGISGLYTAYRLSDEHQNVAIFEASDRLGGRILTVDVPHTEGLEAEMGAMRFLASQKNVLGLLTKEFDFKIKEADLMSTQLYHYLRGQKILYTDYHEHPEKIPYQLAANERGKTPTELFFQTIETIVPGASSKDSLKALAALLQAREIVDASGKPIPLYQWDLNVLLHQHLSGDGYQFLVDAYGFRGVFQPENAYDIILPTFQDYAPHAMFRPVEGMTSLVTRLEDELREHNVMIHTQHALTGIYVVDPKAQAPIFVLAIDGQKYYARHVILTISPKAIGALDKSSILFSDPEIDNILRSAKSSIPAQKLFFVYDHPWWEEMGLSQGRVQTDLTAQQVYYWGSTPEAAMLLASYKDTPATWQEHCDDPKAMFHNRDEVPVEVQAPQCVVDMIEAELKQIHSDPHLPMPHTVLYRDWTPLPIGGAFHRWNVGFKSWELIPKIRKPYEHLNLYITGDNYARGTGWIEVALNSSEKLVTTHFGLERARWIPADYDLGP